MSHNHSHCHDRLGAIQTELAELAENSTLTARQQRRHRALKIEANSLNLVAKRLARADSMARNSSSYRIEAGSQADDYDRDSFAEPNSIEDHRSRSHRNPWDLSEMRTYGRDPEDTATELRSRALSAIEQMPGASARIREAGTSILERFDDTNSTIAKFVLTTSKPAYLRAWSKLACDRGYDLNEGEKRAVAEVRAMSLVDTSGGYLVPFQLDPSVIITADGSRNDIRTKARSVVAIGDVWYGVSSTAVQWH